MEYLLTIASNETDGGSRGRWLAEEERDLWKQGNYAELKATQYAAELMLGDKGNLNYFICRQCDHWPIRAVFQCS
ncbi:MAG: hypothetical protein ACFBSC_15340 [Microcoleaceae cyanobacterium]